MWMIVSKANGRYSFASLKEFNNWHAALLFARAEFGPNLPPPAEPAWVILPMPKAVELIDG